MRKKPAPRPNVRTVQLLIRIPDSLKQRLLERRREGYRMNAIVVKAIELYLDEMEAMQS